NSAEALRGSRILIIDDEPQAAGLLRDILLEDGYREIELVSDARCALTRFVEFQPDLVLLDWKMPHLSGVEVLQQLREHISPDAHVPIIIVTVLWQSEVKMQAL